MECADVEVFAKGLFGSAAERLNSQHANLIAECLARPDRIALNLDRDARRFHAGIRDHIVDRLFAAPALFVNAGIHHEAHRPEELIPQAAKIAVWVGFVKADLLGEAFRVKRPTFRKAVGGAFLPHTERSLLVIHGEGQLEMVARHSLVIGEGGQGKFRLGRGVSQVDEVEAWA